MLQTAPPVKHGKADRRNRQLPHLDGRSKASQRFKRLCKLLTADLGRAPSVAEGALIRQAAAAIVASEQVQGRVLAGAASTAEIKEQSRLGNLATRALIALGLQSKGSVRHALDLDSYLAGRGKS